MTSQPLTFEQIDSMSSQLLDSWNVLYSKPDLETQVRGWTVARIAVVLGLAAHTHALGSAAFQLLRDDIVLAAAPLVRSMFECALTAQWVAQVEGAQDAFIASQARQKRKILKSVDNLPNYRADPDELASLDELVETSKTAWASMQTTFEAICDALEPGGKQAYAHYRVFSALSHPSDILWDHYFGRSEDGLGIGRKVPPAAPSHVGTAAFALASMVWAGQAIEYRLPGRPRRALLRQVASRIGIEPVLRPTG